MLAYKVDVQSKHTEAALTGNLSVWIRLLRYVGSSAYHYTPTVGSLLWWKPSNCISYCTELQYNHPPTNYPFLLFKTQTLWSQFLWMKEIHTALQSWLKCKPRIFFSFKSLEHGTKCSAQDVTKIVINAIEPDRKLWKDSASKCHLDASHCQYHCLTKHIKRGPSNILSMNVLICANNFTALLFLLLFHVIFIKYGLPFSLKPLSADTTFCRTKRWKRGGEGTLAQIIIIMNDRRENHFTAFYSFDHNLQCRVHWSIQFSIIETMCGCWYNLFSWVGELMWQVKHCTARSF